MTARLVRVHPDTYVDSVQLMAATRAMEARPGVDWAAALMGTPANIETLAGEGFDEVALADASANDLVLAARAGGAQDAEWAIEGGESVLAAPTVPAPGREARRPGTLEEAAAGLPGANLAVVSVPGAFATLEAQKAISAGLHVLLFSDNVSVDDEVELKARAADLGLLVMGPGGGTAMLGGVGLGFANAVRRGSVGIVAAAGTGAQEVMCLIDRWGGGVSAVVGIGGRDLSDRVGGRMARLALRAMDADPGVEVVLLVSKPPSPRVAASLFRDLGAKPSVVALVGFQEYLSAPEGVRVARSLEQAAAWSIEALGIPPPDVARDLPDLVTAATTRIPEERMAVRGLFSGGSLCYESMVVLSAHLGAVYSNTPLRDEWGLPPPAGTHVCLDLGEEEYTRGRPHPMIDPHARAELIRREGSDPATAVVLIDVVLGYGAHPDPASALAPVCEDVADRPDGPAVVAYVLGTEADPQGLERQRARLADAGCLLAPTNSRSARMAAAIAARRPEIAGERG